MRELDVFRGTIERAGRIAAGTNPLTAKSTQAAARTATLDSLIARLPINVDDLGELQDYDSGSGTHGAQFFMWDISIWSDTEGDPWA